MQDKPQVRAAIYCRISLARIGDTVKVDEQELVCRRLAHAKGWAVSPEHVYVDNAVSAWKHTVRRKGWEAMLDAIRRGELDAIIVYHGDRLIRQPWDLEILLRLAQAGTLLASPTGERDLGNPDDQFVLRIEAAVAKREVDNTSRRMRAKFDRLAEQGISRLGGRGGRAYGFEPDGLRVRDTDAIVIREAAGRVLAGEPMGAIVRDLNQRGVTTVTGAPWTHGSLKKVLTKPRMAGLLSHNGTIVGPAAWPAILDRETWEAVCSVLAHKASAYDYASNARRYLLSGIARCGPCGQPLAVRLHSKGRQLTGYGCITPGCRKTHRAMHHLDEYVIGATLALLGDEEVRKRMQPVAADTGPLVAELHKVSARLEQTLAEFADDDDLGPDVLRLTVPRLKKRIAELRTQIAAAQVPTVLDGLWGINRDGWDGLGLHRQRAAVGALLRITIRPSRKRGPGFDPSTVELKPA
ncbi:recombinase family protein [Micromonospora sp. L32]|uniref:recombinase family protein n=1 Tax=Micromonospora sp. L32 TaxID=3452214 RepID=UPI003F8A8D61